MKVLFEGKEYDSEHGSFFDRGSADSFYCRAPNHIEAEYSDIQVLD
jgi:hypothetical protein